MDYIREFFSFNLEDFGGGFIDVSMCQFIVNTGLVCLITAPVNLPDVTQGKLPGMNI